MKRFLPTTIRHLKSAEIDLVIHNLTDRLRVDFYARAKRAAKISVKTHLGPDAGLGLSGWGYESSWKGGGVILCGRVSEENRLV